MDHGDPRRVCVNQNSSQIAVKTLLLSFDRDIASALRKDPNTFPVPDAMSLPPNQRDRRPIMAVVYKLFRGTTTEEELALLGSRKATLSDEFYSLFYLALFAEVRQEPTKAAHYMRQSIETQYAQSVGRADYMTAVAKVSNIDDTFF